MNLQRVTQTRTIQVHNIGDVTKDTLGVYFKNKRCSGGGKVTDVHTFPEDNYALVEVEAYESEFLQ